MGTLSEELKLKKERDNEARIGREAIANRQANKRGSEIADEQLARADQIEAEQEAAAFAEAEMVANARREGQLGAQQEMLNSMGGLAGIPQEPTPGLGIGSQTIEGMQQQQVMQQGAMEEAAMGMIQQLSEAQAQGANPEQLNQMFESIPPELKAKVIEMKQLADSQEQQAPQVQVSSTGRPNDPYGITAGSAEILAQTMQP